MFIETFTDQGKIKYEKHLATRRSTSKLFKYFKAPKKIDSTSTMFHGEDFPELDKTKSKLFAEIFGTVQRESSSFFET